VSKIVFAAAVLLQSFCACVAAQSLTFKNPLLPVGPDPWVIYHDNYYYYMNTTGKNLTIWKTKDITDFERRGEENRLDSSGDRTLFS